MIFLVSIRTELCNLFILVECYALLASGERACKIRSTYNVTVCTSVVTYKYIYMYIYIYRKIGPLTWLGGLASLANYFIHLGMEEVWEEVNEELLESEIDFVPTVSSASNHIKYQ